MDSSLACAVTRMTGVAPPGARSRRGRAPDPTSSQWATRFCLLADYGLIVQWRDRGAG